MPGQHPGHFFCRAQQRRDEAQAECSEDDAELAQRNGHGAAGPLAQMQKAHRKSHPL
jgi:hypothetical protein